MDCGTFSKDGVKCCARIARGRGVRTDSPTRVTRSCGHTASSCRSSCTVRCVSCSQLDRSDSGMNNDLSTPRLMSIRPWIAWWTAPVGMLIDMLDELISVAWAAMHG